MRSGIQILLLVVLVGHLLLGLLRIPHAVVNKRGDEIALHGKVGHVSYLLDTKHHKGAAQVEWLLANTPEDSVILWRGEYKGSFELVAHLVYPRLLYEESRVAPGVDTIHDRKVAAKVLVGLGNDLELVSR